MSLNPTLLVGFKDLVARYGINCIADMRSDRKADKAERQFRRFMNENGISYHSFYEEMVRYNPLHYDKKGVWKYDLAVKDEQVVEALERLMRGVRLGYVISVLDEEPETEKSFSYRLVGRYFYDRDVDMMYLMGNGNLISHSALVKRKEGRRQKRLNANALGAKGEGLAVRYLEEHGYVILDRNWNLHRGCELDIVARKDDVFHFVEVKTRISDERSAPVSAINRAKMRNICKAANAYRARNGYRYSAFSIDSIGIVYHSDDDYKIDMYENIANAENW